MRFRIEIRSSVLRVVPRLLGVFLMPEVAAAVVALAPPAAHAQPVSDFVPVTDEMLQDPARDDWLMWRRTLDGWGFRREGRLTY